MDVQHGSAGPFPIVVRPSTGWTPLNLRDLWEYRELLYFLVWRDLKVRYRQTLLGVAWAVIQPSFIALAFSIFFGRLAGMPSDGIPYPLFAFSGLLSWQLFAHGLANAGNSLVANERLITKVYFPRLIVPLSATLSSLVDFFVGFVVLSGLIAYYGIAPSSALWALPALVVLALAATVGASLWLSALNVEYRDVRFIIPFITQLWFFLTPVAYPSSLVPEKWRWLYGLNPMVGVVEGFRWAVLAKSRAPGPWLAVSVAATLAVLVGGLFYFRRMERTFADVV
jgi:lipopolysaccharide transport system permease protein